MKNRKNIKTKKTSTILEKYAENNQNQLITLNFDAGEDVLVVEVKPDISPREKAQMVEYIYDMVFFESESGYESYHPEYIDFAEKVATLRFFTDLELPDDVDGLWSILNTPLYDAILDKIFNKVVEVCKMAEIKIKTKRDYLVRKTDISNLIDKIGNSFGDISEALNGFDIVSLLKKFDGVDKLTEKNIVSAILDLKEVKESEKHTPTPKRETLKK